LDLQINREKSNKKEREIEEKVNIRNAGISISLLSLM